ncbi:MAG: c-type cytochrome [Nitrospiraceae bacterium]|nr:c-type cytochrome [Nitrospiraceae bacterium]
MKTAFAVALALMASITISPSAFAKGPSGKALFQKHCASCHANGGNMDNPAYTLHKKDLQRHGVQTESDIIKRMRHPGPGMPVFSKKKISYTQAKAIAKYIMETYNK